MSENVTHDQALTRLNGHVGETVSVWLTMERPMGDGSGRFGIMRMVGELGHMPSVGIGPAATAFKDALSITYTIDGKALLLPPLPGVIKAYELGLEWVLAEGLTLRIIWGMAAEQSAVVEGGF